jgi:hypothetical protein
VIGGFNIPKLLLCVAPPKAPLVGRLMIAVFFVVHYGMFTFVHGVFIQSMVIKSNSFGVGGLVSHALTLKIAVLSLVISHGASFLTNYVGTREYETVPLPKQMFRPYSRIVVIHLTILFGGFVTQLTSSAVPMLVLLLVLKTIVDLFAHRFEHRGLDHVKAVQSH